MIYKLRRKPDFGAYFKFLDELFALFPSRKSRRPIKGDNFKL